MGHAGRVAESQLDSALLLEVTGDLDVSNADSFVELLFGAARHPDARIVVDLDRADFIDSTVLNALFAVRSRLEDAGGRLAIVCTKDHLYRVLEAAGIDRPYPVVRDREAALAAIR
jgi:anti-sigma B factor antagonist